MFSRAGWSGISGCISVLLAFALQRWALMERLQTITRFVTQHLHDGETALPDRHLTQARSNPENIQKVAEHDGEPDPYGRQSPGECSATDREQQPHRRGVRCVAQRDPPSIQASTREKEIATVMRALAAPDRDKEKRADANDPGNQCGTRAIHRKISTA